MRGRDDRPPLSERFRRWLWGAQYSLTHFRGRVTFRSTLRARLIKANGKVIDYGVVSKRLVTQAFVKRLAAQLAVDFSAGDEWKYHASGTSGTAESNADTVLGTEVGTRVAGTQADVSSGTTGNYRTIGAVTYGGTFSIQEHGIFNAASSGTLLDRSVFAAIVVASGDSIEFTYDLEAQPE